MRATVPLKNDFLLRQRCYIRGAWVDADDGKTVPVKDPATGEQIGTVPRMGAAETRRAVEAADAALAGWRRRTAAERAAVLRAWFDLVVANQEDLATLMTAEQGKTLAQSREEIACAASLLEWSGEEGKRACGGVVPGPAASRRVVVLREPVGVVAVITARSFAAGTIARRVGPALAAGCTVVLKPASRTPFTALALAALGEQAGLPPGALNVVTGPAAPIGEELARNPAVRKLTFSGSPEVGRKLLAQCAGTLKKVSLDLGGDATLIVFDDADLDAAAHGALAASSRSGGPAGVCTTRLLVQAGVLDAFARKLQARVAGAARPAAPGEVDASGPPAPLVGFESEAEAVTIANAAEHRLAASFYTRDLARSWRVQEALAYASVGVNTGLVSTELAPFGGAEEAGTGREGPGRGIDDFLSVKYVCVGGIS